MSDSRHCSQAMTSGCVKEIKNLRIGFQKFENSDDEKSTNSSEESNEILPSVLDYLTPALKEEARTQLNETDETRQKGLAELRKLIEGEKKLVTMTDDLFLLAFLRARKFNVKRAFKLLQNYWHFRKQHKKIYDIEDFDAVRDLILRSFVGSLLYRDKNGCYVFVFKTAFWDPDRDSYENLFRAITAILVYGAELPATQVAGFRAIIDGRGLSWKQLKYFTPSNVLLLIRSTQFCFPARYKGVHILCENKMISFLWNVAYPFLTSKLKKRIFFHGEDLRPLKEYIHLSVLPVEFGGQAPCFDNSSWIDIMKEKESKMREYLTCGYKD